MDEIGVIERFLRHTPQAESVLLGPGDDAAVIKPTPGMGLAMSMDTLLEGRHFPVGFPAEYVGWRSLAVNLSDLAAIDRKSTRLNSSHVSISYAVFCLKKK